MKKELLERLDKVPTYVQQLQFTVKEPTVGRAATFSKVDNVIQETKHLMNVISKVVTTCFDCANKVTYPFFFPGIFYQISSFYNIMIHMALRKLSDLFLVFFKQDLSALERNVPQVPLLREASGGVVKRHQSVAPVKYFQDFSSFVVVRVFWEMGEIILSKYRIILVETDTVYLHFQSFYILTY